MKKLLVIFLLMTTPALAETFGHNVQGDSSVFDYDRCMSNVYDVYTASTGDTVTEIHIYAKATTPPETIDVAVYTTTTGGQGTVPNTIVGTSHKLVIGSTDLADCSVTGLTIELSNGVEYCLTFGNSTDGPTVISFAFDGPITTANCRKDDPCSSLPSPWGVCDSQMDRRISIWAVYTTAGETVKRMKFLK